MNSTTLIEIPWPDFGSAPAALPLFPASEYERRIERTRAAMHRAGLDVLAVYGDREHFANLSWLTGFDPRFEEALLLLGRAGTPLVLTGIECAGYLAVSPLELRQEVVDAFSLPDMPARQQRSLGAILAAEGIVPGARLGIVGGKTYARPGDTDVPSYLAEALRSAAAGDAVNATGLLADLRSSASAAEIAWFEASNVFASEAMKRLIGAVRDGATDHEMIAAAGFNGVPQGCHWGLKTADHRTSLASPNGTRVRRGGPLSANICYWGSNVCRAAWVVESAAELPEEARDYVETFAGPYWSAMAEWLEMLTPGRPGGELFALIQQRLPAERFGVRFPAGHLTHLEEWLRSPFREGSRDPVLSGMIVQSDVIPSAPWYFSTRMEDGYAVADEALRDQLRREWPECWGRVQARRRFLREVAGIAVPEEVLPLSNLAGLAPPFLLRPGLNFARE